RVKYVFVDGKKFDVPEPERTRPSDPPFSGAGSASLSGSWALKVNSPEGPVDATLDLTQSGRALTGKLRTHIGDADLREGNIAGNSLSFKVTMNSPDGGSLVASFTATVQGNSMTGSVDAGPRGKMDFSGSRIP
ncbi:MAG: hypothetical protein ACREUU_07660, partial [Gammaproteobacteria bacterium]